MQYLITRSGGYFGISLFAGEVVEQVTNNTWKIVSPSGNNQGLTGCIFYGNLLKGLPFNLQGTFELVEAEIKNKTRIELKVREMWNRQPFIASKGTPRKTATATEVIPGVWANSLIDSWFDELQIGN